MKNLKNIALAVFSLVLLFSCGTDEKTVAKVADENGVLINVSSQSSGAFLGSPEQGVDIPMAPVTVSDAFLNLVVAQVSGSLSNISKMEVVKSLNGGPEVSVAESSTLPFTVELTSIEDFLSGLGMGESDLRIGDELVFKVKAHQTDGDVFYYNDAMGVFKLVLNCSYDLTGTYTMTNTVCASVVTVNITQNADGTWYVDQADGGLLQFCSSNTTLTNQGSFAVSCGGVVLPSSDVRFCGGYGIGCIQGGTWDGNTLILQNGNDFFSWADSSYTSTYVRQ